MIKTIVPGHKVCKLKFSEYAFAKAEIISYLIDNIEFLALPKNCCDAVPHCLNKIKRYMRNTLLNDRTVDEGLYFHKLLLIDDKNINMHVLMIDKTYLVSLQYLKLQFKYLTWA
jgi:hypothetical protein